MCKIAKKRKVTLSGPEFNFRKSLDTLKMENPTHRFRETNVELAKHKRGHFLYCLFCPKEFF